MIADFNAKSKDWCSTDITSCKGSKLDLLTSQFGLSQIIKEPTHILDNSRSCIDLIFTFQPNMVIDSGVHGSLHSNCHHQVIYLKFDLKIFYPPPNEKTVWHFKHAKSDHIKRAIDIFDWESSAAVRTGLLWIDNTSTCLQVRFMFFFVSCFTCLHVRSTYVSCTFSMYVSCLHVRYCSW